MSEPVRRSYGFSDALRLTPASRGQLGRWCAAGIIPADHGGGGTSGSHRKFSFRNLIEIWLTCELFSTFGPDVSDILEDLREWDFGNDRDGEDHMIEGRDGFSQDEFVRPEYAERAARSFNRFRYGTDDDNASRWLTFSRPSTRRTRTGLLLIGSVEYAVEPNVRRVSPSGIHFFTDFSQLQTYLTRHLELEKDYGVPARDTRLVITHTIIDVERILAALERASEDSLDGPAEAPTTQ